VAIVAASAAFTHIAMHRMLRYDVTLAIRTDALCVQRQGTETVVS
jgi:hypothetical protein